MGTFQLDQNDVLNIVIMLSSFKFKAYRNADILRSPLTYIVFMYVSPYTS
jgi:hypothetical protein